MMKVGLRLYHGGTLSIKLILNTWNRELWKAVYEWPLDTKAHDDDATSIPYLLTGAEILKKKKNNRIFNIFIISTPGFIFGAWSKGLWTQLLNLNIPRLEISSGWFGSMSLWMEFYRYESRTDQKRIKKELRTVRKKKDNVNRFTVSKADYKIYCFECITASCQVHSTELKLQWSTWITKH